mmetsp:Transcript_70202/g.203557  ORF Transcript_70202/g.203557 Transcript_70202/m.203557 type:complete len:264 (-) Transcript_70202:66-857(-)
MLCSTRCQSRKSGQVENTSGYSKWPMLNVSGSRHDRPSTSTGKVMSVGMTDVAEAWCLMGCAKFRAMTHSNLVPPHGSIFHSALACWPSSLQSERLTDKRACLTMYSTEQPAPRRAEIGTGILSPSFATLTLPPSSSTRGTRISKEPGLTLAITASLIFLPPCSNSRIKEICRKIPSEKRRASCRAFVRVTASESSSGVSRMWSCLACHPADIFRTRIPSTSRYLRKGVATWKSRGLEPKMSAFADVRLAPGGSGHRGEFART